MSNEEKGGAFPTAEQMAKRIENGACRPHFQLIQT